MRFLRVAGGPGDFRDQYPVPAPAAGYGGYVEVEAGLFSAGDARDEGGGDPEGDACPPPGAGPCQDLTVIRYGTGAHAV